ncbi:MAG: branched-chain amino acid ABC transporter permease [Actinobacteria bacterium]|nr:branched-chain amino acid ABC transporter permease [Actinomycetota bacterium]
MEQALVQILNGLSTAGILILVALGLAITFGLLGVINLAHGELFMLGAYTAVIVTDAGGSTWLGMALAPLAVGVLGLVMERGVIKRLYSRPFDTLLATFAIGIILREAMTLWRGGRFERVPNPIQRQVEILGARYSMYRLFLLALGVLVLVGAALLLYRSRLGRNARAAIENREIAAAMGVDVRVTDSAMFALGAGLAGLAGAAISPLVSVEPNMGLSILASSFFVVILGGTGSLPGVAAGAALIGGGQALVSWFADPVIAQITVFLLAIVVIRLAPRGLFGR